MSWVLEYFVVYLSLCVRLVTSSYLLFCHLHAKRQETLTSLQSDEVLVLGLLVVVCKIPASVQRKEKKCRFFVNYLVTRLHAAQVALSRRKLLTRWSKIAHATIGLRSPHTLTQVTFRLWIATPKRDYTDSSCITKHWTKLQLIRQGITPWHVSFQTVYN